MNRARLWRSALLALCVVGIVAISECAWATYYLDGDLFGGSVYDPPTIAAFLDRFDAITPGSVTQRSGIQPGDEVDLLRMTPAARYYERDELLAGKPIQLALRRGGVERVVTLTPVPYTTTAFWLQTQWWLAWAFWIGSAFSLFIAALLVWRRPESLEVRLLALTLILIQLGENLFPINGFLTPWIALDVALNVVAQFLFCAGVALFAGYALLFGRPVSLARKIFTGVAFAVAGLSALIWTGAAQGGPSPAGALGIAGLWSGTLDIHAWLATRPLPLFLAIVGPPALALLCAVLAVRSASGEERSRVAWATGSLAVLYVFGIATVQSYFTSNSVVFYTILNLSWVVAPCGLAYALLSRRLLDVGFVLNRAAVFTAVSILVVGLFTLAEWALAGWLNTAGRVANVAVSAAIALALGLSLHQIHGRVDRFVDRVFFRKRHEDEDALKRFAREVAFITDRDVVIQRATEMLVRHADASVVSFVLDDGAGHYGAIGENDAALVTMRASHEVVDLRLVESALVGEFAYPMLARGRLIGALILGAKTSGEPYAPDESGAIAQLAHGVGIALDLLGVRQSGDDAAIIGALRSLETLSRAANEALADLPDAVAAKLLKQHL
ncbi:MAG TPA: hypothetical protein VKT51_11460 [Candidatus Eremiobacteraceae bacterium]|nr:hypothetical protein [Candidatus Eremiobacteraceae bacterium]